MRVERGFALRKHGGLTVRTELVLNVLQTSRTTLSTIFATKTICAN